jgi:hypothetical protein
MKLTLFALLAFPLLAMSGPKCEEGDALKGMSVEQRKVALALGADWLKHAMYCDFGTYQVITSADPKSDAIMIIKAGQPFISYEQGFGINLFQDLGANKVAPYVTVQDWDHDGKFERLDYLLVDAAGNVVGNARDKAMTGAVVVTSKKDDQAGRK